MNQSHWNTPLTPHKREGFLVHNKETSPAHQVHHYPVEPTHLWPGRCSAPPRPRWWCHRCTLRSPLGSELWLGIRCLLAGRWTVRRWGGESPASTRTAGGGPGELAAGDRWGRTLGREPDGFLCRRAPPQEGLLERERRGSRRGFKNR